MSAATSAPHPGPARAAPPIPYELVVYREYDAPKDGAHLASKRGGPLTRCGRIALLRLVRGVLEPHETVCEGCTGVAPVVGR